MSGWGINEMQSDGGMLTPGSGLPHTDASETTAPYASLPVSDHMRRYIHSVYRVDPNTPMFYYPDQPQRVFILQGATLNYVDVMCTCSSLKQKEKSANALGSTSNPLPLALKSPQASSPLDQGIDSSQWHSIADSERISLHKERRKTNAYKTALCREFRETGNCVYGDACRFAHGQPELRLPPQAHPKYKTQLCNKYALFGHCPYGARCQFVHRRPNAPNQSSGRCESSFDEPQLVNGLTYDQLLPNQIVRQADKSSRSSWNKVLNSQMTMGGTLDAGNGSGFSGSLPSSILKKAMSSWKKQNVIFEDEEKCEIYDKALRDPSNNERSPVNSDPYHEFPLNEHFEGWTRDESDGLFSQSCFPGLRS